jgi:hypothetical protein
MNFTKKLATILLAMAGTVVMANASGLGFNACPNVGNDTAGCQLLISVTSVSASGVGTAYFVTQNSNAGSAGPFDESDDTLIGIQNDSSSGPALTSIVLDGTLGSDIAGFDGDGACTSDASTGPDAGTKYTPGPTVGAALGDCAALTTTDPNDYESNGVVFSNYSTLSSDSTNDDVTLTFSGAGLARATVAGGSCGSAWFSLESALTTGSFSGGTAGTSCASVGPTPEPSSMDLLGLGSMLVGIVYLVRKRQTAR